MIQLAPISKERASKVFFENTPFRGPFDFAICVVDLDQNIHGVIGLTADGKDFRLAHLWTDANAQVGSLLYGGAWRVAKALGYKQIWI